MWPNLELKTRPKQLLGSLPLDITLPDPLIVCDLQGHHLAAGLTQSTNTVILIGYIMVFKKLVIGNNIL